jgi:hypothetical protein
MRAFDPACSSEPSAWPGVADAARLGVRLRVVLAQRDVAELDGDVVCQLVHRDGLVGGIDGGDVIDHHVGAADVERVIDVRVGEVARDRRLAGFVEAAVAVTGRDRDVADDDVGAARLEAAAHDDHGPGAVWPAMVTLDGMFMRDAVSQPLPFESQPLTAVRPC